MQGHGTYPPATPELLEAVAAEVRRLNNSGRAASSAPASSVNPLDAGEIRDSSIQPLLADIVLYLQGIESPSSAIGRMPPQPPTLRGRVGAIFVRIVRRCLFWFSIQINEDAMAAGDLLRRLASHVAGLERDRLRHQNLLRTLVTSSQSLEAEREAALARISELERLLASTQRELRGQFASQLATSAKDAIARETQARALLEATLRRDLGSETDAKVASGSERLLQSLQPEFESARTELARATEALRAEFGQRLANALTQTNHEAALAQLRSELLSSQRQSDLLVHRTRAALQAQEARISALARRGAAAPQLPQPNSDVHSDQLGSLYVDFENAFRGSRDEIKRRVAEYIPLVREHGIGGPDMPVLDLGCGRGEWLEVLKEAGLAGKGVDSNPATIAECTDRGLDARTGDALTALESLPDQTQGAVTAFHVAEHLPMAVLFQLLNQAVRVLKPGGLLILETPNPANLTVGSHTFYLDPTHIRPLPADLLRFLVEASGFYKAEIRPLHPFEDSYRIDPASGPAAAVINNVIYGPRDYAVIAHRP